MWQAPWAAYGQCIQRSEQISLRSLEQHLIAAVVGFTRLNDAILHAAGYGDLVCEVFLRLHHGVVDLMITLNFYYDVLFFAVRFISNEYKVWIVAANGAGIWINVLNEKI